MGCQRVDEGNQWDGCDSEGSVPNKEIFRLVIRLQMPQMLQLQPLQP
jgi:hypothetical protein